MNTQTKGVIGVTHAIADLTEKGYNVSIPISEHSHFDLIASKNGEHKTIQVKYRKLKKNGAFEIKLSSNWSNSKGVHKVPMDKAIIDIVCAYCPDTGKCYYFDPSAFEKNVTIRVKLPSGRGNQPYNFNMADSYSDLPD